MSYRRPPPEPIEDYTNAFLTSVGVILFMGFWVLASVAGFFWVAIAATAINWGVRLLRR